MPLPVSLLEVYEHNASDYKPLIDYQSWRVALMNYTPDLQPEKIARMQKHTATDEVFVLLTGCCILFLGAERNALLKSLQWTWNRSNFTTSNAGPGIHTRSA